MDYTISLLEDIITKLKADLVGHVGTRVYSHIPQQEIFPFVRVSIETSADRCFTHDENKYNVTVQVWSEKDSPKEVLVIREAIYSSLKHWTPPSVPAVLFLPERQAYFLEPDGKVYQGNISFRVEV